MDPSGRSLVDPSQKPRLEPRMVFLAVALALIGLYLAGRAVLVRDECDPADEAQVGGLEQVFVPGSGCERQLEQPVRQSR